MDDDDPTTEFGPRAGLSRPVTQRTLLAVAVITGLLSIAAGVLISTVLVERGPPGSRGAQGPAGEAGPPGAEGDAAETSVDPEEVHAAIEEDPARVAEAVADELDFAPTSDLEDVRVTADDAASALRELCGQLQFAEALSDLILSC